MWIQKGMCCRLRRCELQVLVELTHPSMYGLNVRNWRSEDLRISIAWRLAGRGRPARVWGPAPRWAVLMIEKKGS